MNAFAAAPVLEDATARLELLADHHVEALRQACAADTEIWQIYPLSFAGECFDPSLAFVRALPHWTTYAVHFGNTVVGMSSYIALPDPAGIEIGGTYLAPQVRGTGFNRAVKALMIGHAFANGHDRVEFRVDTRNRRSMRAVEKLGAQLVEVLEGNLQTWTGYLRDTAVYRLVRSDWQRSGAAEG